MPVPVILGSMRDESHATPLQLRDKASYSRHTVLDDGGHLVVVTLFHSFFRMEGGCRWSWGSRHVVEISWRRLAAEGIPRDWRSCVATFVKRVVRMEDGGVRGERAVDLDMEQQYPALHEYLTLDWMDGEARETATLGISVDAGQFKARLADRDAGLVTFVSADGFLAVLEALERQLAAGTADWRRDQYSKAKPARKRP